MSVGDYFQKEELCKEFKKFCLNPEMIDIEESEIVDILLKSCVTQKLNRIIHKHLRDYLSKVFVKYFSTFMNSRIHGEILIGIDDDGFYRGIPTLDRLNQKNITECLQNMSECIHPLGINILEYVEIVIKPLQINCENITNYCEILKLKQYFEFMEKYQNDLVKYRRKHREWKKSLDKYSCALKSILNNNTTRKELRDFIVENSALEKQHYEMIQLLNSNQKIEMNLRAEELEKYKQEKNPLTNSIYYWLLKFQKKKDYHSHIKPKKPIRPKCKTPRLILSGLNFVDHHCNYSVLIIKIKGDTYDGQDIYFRNSKRRKKSNLGELIKRIRTNSKNGPSCMPIC